MSSCRAIAGRITAALRPLYDEREAQQIARIVIEERGGVPLAAQIADPERPCTIADEERIVRELAAGRPMQYVLGVAEFYSMRLAVREGVLIPRPETEELVARVLEDGLPERPALLDVGCGSGCIAIALAKRWPDARVTAVDLSEQALAVTRENAAALGVAVEVVQADALGDLLPERAEAFDRIVSNPPYVLESDRAQMQRNVLDYEPAEALFVPDDDPLRYYRAIACHARRLLRPGGGLWFEIHEEQGPQTMAMLAEEGWVDVQLFRDFRGKNRMICSRKP